MSTPEPSAFYNNVFYIARKGPNNTSFVDPDNSILIFSPKELLGIPSDEDTLIGRVPNIDPLGQGLVSAYNISSLTSFNDQTINMIVTLTGENSFKAQWFEYVITPIDQRYISYFAANSVSFMIPNNFSRPEGSADHTSLSARDIALEAMKIAANICIYTNDQIVIEEVG